MRKRFDSVGEICALQNVENAYAQLPFHGLDMRKRCGEPRDRFANTSKH